MTQFVNPFVWKCLHRWQEPWTASHSMKRGRLISRTVVSASAIAVALLTPGAIRAQGQPAPQVPPGATFRSSVDLVRVAAIVRDHKGRFVLDLAARDFEVL